MEGVGERLLEERFMNLWLFRAITFLVGLGIFCNMGFPPPTIASPTPPSASQKPISGSFFSKYSGFR